MANPKNPVDGAEPQSAEPQSAEPQSAGPQSAESPPIDPEAPAAEGKKRFLLRLDPVVWAGLEKWAADELRSVNAEIEFLLKEALRKAGRLGR